MNRCAALLVFFSFGSQASEPVYLDCHPNSSPETVAFELTIDPENDKVTYSDAVHTIKAEAFYTADTIRFSFTRPMAGQIMNYEDFEIDRASLEYTSVSIVHISGQLDIAEGDAIRSSGRCEVKKTQDRKI